MILIIDDYGVSIERKSNRFLLRRGKVQRTITPLRVTGIHVRKPCDMATAAVLLAAEHDIPVLFFDSRGKVQARLWQARFGSHAEIRREQLRWSEGHDGLVWACAAIVTKLQRQSQVLRWLGNRVPGQREGLKTAYDALKALMPRIAKAPADKQQIRTLEGQAGRIYWAAYFDALEKYEAADKRTRQPATDPLNALINYGYGMLYGEVEGAVLTAGLDPAIGVLHADEYARPAFVFDAIEPFRPWVDRLVAELVLTGKLEHDWFSIDPKRVWLTRKGKQQFIPAWYRMLLSATRVSGMQLKRRDQVQRSMMELAASLLDTSQSSEEQPP